MYYVTELVVGRIENAGFGFNSRHFCSSALRPQVVRMPPILCVFLASYLSEQVCTTIFNIITCIIYDLGR